VWIACGRRRRICDADSADRAVLDKWRHRVTIIVAIHGYIATLKEERMGSKLSIDQVLEQLEAKIAHHRESQAFHAQQEVLHREQAALHAGELATAIERFEAFRAASEAAGELLDRSRPGAAAQAAKDADMDLGKGRPLSAMIARVIEGKAADETFGPSVVTKEINERWGAKLRRKVDPRTVAATLRRWAAAGRIHQTREGRAYYESLYVKK